MEVAFSKDFLCRLYEYIDYRSFWWLRLVAKKWEQASRHSQRHWLVWLELYGSRTWDTTGILRPKILKTVPLHRQVMRQAMVHRRSKLRKELARDVTEKTTLETRIVWVRKRIEQEKRELDYVQFMETQYPPQRRRKPRIEINISNDY